MNSGSGSFSNKSKHGGLCLIYLGGLKIFLSVPRKKVFFKKPVTKGQHISLKPQDVVGPAPWLVLVVGEWVGATDIVIRESWHVVVLYVQLENLSFLLCGITDFFSVTKKQNQRPARTNLRRHLLSRHVMYNVQFLLVWSFLKN